MPVEIKNIENLLINNPELVMKNGESIEISGVLFYCLSINDLTIKRGINEHSQMKITGNSDILNADILLGKMDKEIKIRSFQVGGLKSDLLFSGIIERIEIKNGPISSEFIIEAKSFSIQLDKLKKKRSFQDVEKSYSDLIKIVKEEGKYEKFNFISSKKLTKEKIDKLIVQYEESDWEFLKRIAISSKEVIVLEDGKSNVESSDGGNGKKWNIWFGLPDRGEKVLQHEKSVTKIIGKNGESQIKIEIPKRYEIGDKINYNGKVYLIIEANTMYIKNVIQTEYILIPEGKIIQKPVYNHNISGKSILAEVVEVGTGENLTRVRLDFIFDNSNPLLESKSSGNLRTGWNKYWFKFATPYSGTSGGIYFMPEIKDRVLLTFMDNEEENCYAGESLRDTNEYKDKSPEVEHKRIKISTGQQVMLSKKLEKVMIIGNEDRTVFADFVKDHIRFVVDKTEGIINKEGVNFKIGASSIVMTEKGIEIKCGSSSIKLDKGGKVEIAGS